MEISDRTALLWGRFLGQISDETFTAAVDHWIRTERHAPTIADMLGRVAAEQGVDAETQWARVLRIVRGGLYHSPDFACPSWLVKAVNAAGGWHVIGQTEETDLHWRKAEFTATLKGIALPPQDAEAALLSRRGAAIAITAGAIPEPMGAIAEGVTRAAMPPRRNPVSLDGLGKLSQTWQETKEAKR